MNLEFESLRDNFFHRIVTPLDEGHAAKKQVSRKEKKETRLRLLRRNAGNVALEYFKMISRFYHLMKIANMQIPPSKVKTTITRLKNVDQMNSIFFFLAKEGIYARYIKARAKQSRDEIQKERLEERLKKYRENIEREFRIYMDKLKGEN